MPENTFRESNTPQREPRICLKVYVPPEVAARVRAAAQADGRTVSNWIRNRLLTALVAPQHRRRFPRPEASARPPNRFDIRRQEAHQREIRRREAELRDQQADDQASLLRRVEEK